MFYFRTENSKSRFPTKDPTQKLPLLCRCGCTDHSSVQRCCQSNEIPVFTHVFTHVVAPRVHPAFTPVFAPASLCTPGTPRATRVPSPSGQAKNGFARAHIIPGRHAAQSCTECFEQGWRICVDLHGVLWSVMARRWCSCLAPKV